MGIGDQGISERRLTSAGRGVRSRNLGALNVSTCANHPVKMATARCKCCGKPLCSECKHVTDAGIFCSPECETRTRQFQSRVSDDVVRHRKVFPFRQLVGGVIVLLLAAGAFGAVAHFFMGVDSVADMKALLNKWWEARHLLF